MNRGSASELNGLRLLAGRYRHPQKGEKGKGEGRKPPSLGGLRSRVQGRHLVLEYLCFRVRLINCTLRDIANSQANFVARVDDPVPQALVIALPMVVGDELLQSTLK
jgi:hypothetical protein